MRVAIIEDEPINANELKALIYQYDGTIIIDPVLDTIGDSIAYLKLTPPDLLFLDIELADGNSFEIFNHITVDCPIIFTTAYDQYALKSFEQNSISYLLKPITFQSLKSAFDKLSSMKQNFSVEIANIFQTSSGYKEKFLVRSGAKLIPLNQDQIAYFHSQDSISYIVSSDTVKYLSSNTLNELEDLLNPDRFMRINRQYIVSREIISHLVAHEKGQVKLCFKDDIEKAVVISREKTPILKAWLS